MITLLSCLNLAQLESPSLILFGLDPIHELWKSVIMKMKIQMPMVSDNVLIQRILKSAGQQ